MNELFESMMNIEEAGKKSDTRKIKVKHPGILEVPEDKNFWELPLKHYIDLAKKKGRAAIARALNNLRRWNKKKNPDIAKKAEEIMNKLEKNKKWQELGKKNESIESKDLVMSLFESSDELLQQFVESQIEEVEDEEKVEERAGEPEQQGEDPTKAAKSVKSADIAKKTDFSKVEQLEDEEKNSPKGENPKQQGDLPKGDSPKGKEPETQKKEDDLTDEVPEPKSVKAAKQVKDMKPEASEGKVPDIAKTGDKEETIKDLKEEEDEEASEVAEEDKQYLGKSEDKYFYLKVSKDEEGNVGSVQVLDAEGNEVLNIDEVENIVDVIRSIVDQLELEEIAFDIVEDYIIAPLEKEAEEEEEEEEEEQPEEEEGEEFPEEEKPEEEETPAPEEEPVESIKEAKDVEDEVGDLTHAWGVLVDLVTDKYSADIEEAISSAKFYMRKLVDAAKKVGGKYYKNVVSVVKSLREGLKQYPLSYLDKLVDKEIDRIEKLKDKLEQEEEVSEAKKKRSRDELHDLWDLLEDEIPDIISDIGSAFTSISVACHHIQFTVKDLKGVSKEFIKNVMSWAKNLEKFCDTKAKSLIKKLEDYTDDAFEEVEKELSELGDVEEGKLPDFKNLKDDEALIKRLLEKYGVKEEIEEIKDLLG